MAGGSAKRTLDGNRRAFRQLTQIHAGITGIALLGRWLGHSFPTTLGDMVLLVLPHVVIAMLTNRLYGMARPVFNEYGKLDDAGVNLNDRGGTMPYYWDLIYRTLS
ncbi:hypothetical protein CXG81DRAFT_27519 [Caulochytrium protostelioides]|uniref:Uncharacterized protein n=1 Tax=Caulochytrium protostelioides TaxID=1555241 RepID=A0A4V1ITC7_9FUNG|nr:hypothetical protein CAUPRSCDRAFT_11711 [Caulochytrium protostelioides]RKO99724.1 hypothetical protein CXG81DRAFT_27519 [Caulochytrium protostelioides]|eukprot:RKO99724.1 hypothetical protein CXG81DRAFT_27519 [Caulochytrium protostelioides]